MVVKDSSVFETPCTSRIRRRIEAVDANPDNAQIPLVSLKRSGYTPASCRRIRFVFSNSPRQQGLFNISSGRLLRAETPTAMSSADPCENHVGVVARLS